ncbi:hypothetical protein SASC598J21_002510 [Snodgrassella alvi SCGC AB-598-J21]|uniref:Uncharacterized protein n=1 Tax=Snodgrassella alvi SCGC AB-598-J21 TaxID=1385367 RepID=A0A074W3M6_9NEIS|nr:hypothetical protein SASC598J21_003480 [Snodgrassella alvi SCGC AB-598-J21]KEQ01969.1 hypothetical protein SASC598J21_002510 [Snodgrassella alvi SCGC AB-598-J21]
MNKLENKFIGLCLAKNNYFAATIYRLEEVEGYANVYVMVNRKDTWESYKSFSIQSMFSNLGRKQFNFFAKSLELCFITLIISFKYFFII